MQHRLGLRKKRACALLTTLLTGALLVGCGGIHTPPPGGTYFAASGVIGNGVVQPFVVLDRSGNPTTLGLRVTAAALQNLPAGAEELILALPPQATGTGYDHISMDWSPNGHDPAGIYDVAHFDVHFYRISQVQRSVITGVGADAQVALRAPAADEIPTDYVSTGSVVPMMGVHWIDPTSPEFQGQPFTATFIYGFYDAKVVFIEPMIALSLLTAKTDFRAAIKQPAVYPGPGYYPTRYSVTYDAAKQEYRILLEGLTPKGQI